MPQEAQQATGVQIRRAHTRRDLRLIIVHGCFGGNDSRTCRKLRRCCLLCCALSTLLASPYHFRRRDWRRITTREPWRYLSEAYRPPDCRQARSAHNVEVPAKHAAPLRAMPWTAAAQNSPCQSTRFIPDRSGFVNCEFSVELVSYSLNAPRALLKPQ